MNILSYEVSTQRGQGRSDRAQSHQFLMGAQSTTLNFETASVPQAVSRS